MDDLKLSDDEHFKVLEDRVAFLERVAIYQFELIQELYCIAKQGLNQP